MNPDTSAAKGGKAFLPEERNEIVVLGAGIMGLTAAYELQKKGFRVTVLEKDDRLGGMSASFDFAGTQTERFYHFLCKSDAPVFQLLHELGLEQRLRWNETRMGFFFEGAMYRWGTPWTLAKFPHLDVLTKLRFALQVFVSVHRQGWKRLDRLTGTRWIEKNLGDRGYRVLWASLLKLKFHRFEKQISAAWVARRLKRMGLSRKNLFHEELGFIEGGVGELIGALESRFRARGGRIMLNAAATEIRIDPSAKTVTGVMANGREFKCDKVLSTIPLPYFSSLAPGLPDAARAPYQNQDNIGVVCVILKLTRPLTPYFWTNINDRSIELPGIIEFSNLTRAEDKIVYFPFYLPADHVYFSKPDNFFIEKVSGYCAKLQPGFDPSWLSGSRVHRYQYAQPVCRPGFLNTLPPVSPGISGLFVVDTSFYYPEDRSMAESIRLGQKMAFSICEQTKISSRTMIGF
jgi:protoporphyrinogen oxidase